MLYNCMRGDRKLATATEPSQERTLGQTRETCFGVVQCGRALNCELIISASLDCNRTLAYRRQHLVNRNSRADPLLQAEPHQTRRRKYYGVILAFIEFSNARIDVATQILDDNVAT